MTLDSAWNNVTSVQILDAVMPSIEAHLQEALQTWEEIDTTAIPKLEPELQPVVMALLNQQDERRMSPDNLLHDLRGQLSGFLDNALSHGVVLDDLLMGPIVRRFGAALLNLSEALEDIAAEKAESTEVLLSSMEGMVDRITDDPARLNQATDTDLRELIARTLEKANDPEVIRTYINDRLAGARDYLKSRAQFYTDAAAWLDERLTDLPQGD